MADRIAGGRADIEELKKLAEVFGCGIAPGHDDRWWLSGCAFDNLSYADEVRQTAIKVLTRLNRIVRLHSDQFRPVQFVGVSQRRPDGRTAHFISAVFAGHAGLTDDRGDLGWTRRLQRIAHHDPKLWEVVAAVGDEITWQKLRVAFERICALVSGRTAKGAWDNALVKNGYAIQDEISRFKANAEDPQLSGLNAVHGVSQGPPRGTKMTEQEGMEFIRRLLNFYLDGQP